MLQRTPDETPARWSRVHQPGQGRIASAASADAYRVRIEAGARQFGSIWALRQRSRGEPDRTETRLLSAAADQVGQALALDRLAAESQAAEIARQSDALKSALLQSVSHDLRTPLATIRAAAGTLRPGSGLSAHDQQESADAIDREVEYLNRLVTNLLDLSRIEAGALRAERDVYELDDLVGQTVDRLRPRLGDRPLEVVLDARPVEVDPVFLDEALTNAIENAIKYTPPEAAIRIVAEPLASEPYVRLTIEDAGPGVPDQALSRIFDKFYRVPGRGRRIEVRDGHRSGGRSRADRGDRRSGRGSSQRARRARDRHGPADGRAHGVGRRGHRVTGRERPRTDPGPTILVVEDDDETRQALVRELTARGFRTDVAPDGRTALLRWESRRPDVVLLDLGLPDIDGLDVVRRIRSEATTPIVILSGRYEEREKVQALERGADDYVTKPFGVDELNARLRVAIRRASGPVADRDGRITAGPLEFDAVRHEARVDGSRLDLTPREFEILRVFLTNAGRLVTKGRLLRAVWGEAYQGQDSYVYVHVSQLRRKLAAADSDGCAARPDRDRAGRRLPGPRAGSGGDFRRTLGRRDRPAVPFLLGGRWEREGMESSADRPAPSIGRTLEQEMALVREAIAMVAERRFAACRRRRVCTSARRC